MTEYLMATADGDGRPITRSIGRHPDIIAAIQAAREALEPSVAQRDDVLGCAQWDGFNAALARSGWERRPAHSSWEFDLHRREEVTP